MAIFLQKEQSSRNWDMVILVYFSPNYTVLYIIHIKGKFGTILLEILSRENLHS